MKIYIPILYNRPDDLSHKLLLVMKLTAILLISTLLQVNAAVSIAQKVTLAEKNAPLQKIFKEIRKQTGYNFLYDYQTLSGTKNVTINVSRKPMVEVLNLCFIGQPVTYDIKNNTIVVKNLTTKSTPVVVDVVQGKVVNEKGEPLAGVSVKVKNKEQVTISNSNGEFKVTLALNDVVLVSFIGYKAQEISYQGQPLAIRMALDATGLNEVLVVGYGTQTRGNISGAVGKVSFNDIKDQSVPNYDQAFIGKIAGVQVLQTTGEPGSGATFRIRGTGSISAGNSPLIVVDGYPLDAQNQANEFVNMNDVESIEVLKDASSAAIYGSRGANGVILITTKKGKSGSLKVNYSNITGIQRVSKKIDMLDAYQFAQLAKDGHDNAWVDFAPGNSAATPDADRGSVENAGFYWNQTPPELYPYLNGTPGLTNTDWQEEIFRSALITNQSVSFSGGTELNKFFVSANYTDQDGVVINSGYKRYSARVNLDSKSNKFGFGVSFVPSYSVEKRINDEGPYTEQSVIGSALQMSPTWPVYNPDGSYNFNGNGKWRIGKDYQHNAILNPVAISNLIDNQVDHTNLLGRMYLNYEFFKNLKYEVSVGATLNEYKNSTYRPSTLPNLGEAFYTSPSNPVATNSQTFIYNWIIEHTLNYTKSFGSHNFKFLAGFSSQKNNSKQNNVKATNFPNDLVHTINAGQVIEGSANIQEWSLLSALSRVQYDYKGKYLLTAALRSDGSSRFGKNNKWGYFPSVSTGWKLSEEEFMKEISAISNLKLRASYGITGNFQIGNYEQVSRIGVTDYVLGTGNGQNISGLSTVNISNDNLGWEKTEMVNLGLDVGFFKQRLNLEIDVYNKNTSDLLLNVPVPLASGFGVARQNVGKVNNRGIEATLSSQNTFNKLTWDVSANISANRNEVKALGPGNAPIIQTNGTGNTFFITQVGSPIGSYYLLKHNGVYLNQQDLANNPSFSGARPGDIKFVDVDGDGVLDVNKDRTIVGNYFPDYTFGITNRFSYKGFDLSFSFQGVQGVEIINLQNRYINNMEGNFNSTTDALNRWQSEADPGDGLTNRANRKAKGNNGRSSTWHVEDGSYIRLQNLTLGYTIPSSIMKRLKLNSARIFLTGQNIHTWTNYSGYNPEVNLYDSDALTPGLDYGTYPLNKTFSIGLNLNF